MGTRTECIGYGSTGAHRQWRFSSKEILTVVLALALVAILTYAETWAIEQAPVWSGESVIGIAAVKSGATAELRTATASDVAESPLPDTAGPVAVLH